MRTTAMEFESAMKNPGATFGAPETLYASSDFTAEQKRAILRQWQDQLEQLQHADEENMRAPEPPTGDTGEYLRRVTDLLTKLEDRP
jgi:hypothetical protein